MDYPKWTDVFPRFKSYLSWRYFLDYECTRDSGANLLEPRPDLTDVVEEAFGPADGEPINTFEVDERLAAALTGDDSKIH